MNQTTPPEIRAFFDSYRDAFNRLDGEAVARLYAVPSGIQQSGIYTFWTSFDPIADNMTKLCKLYMDNGFVSAAYEVSAFLRQGEFAAVADLFWTIERSDGLEPWRFHTTYNVMRIDYSWRILLCTAYEEQRHKT